MRAWQMLYPAESSSRGGVRMDGMWKFSLDERQEGEKNGWKTGCQEGK